MSNTCLRSTVQRFLLLVLVLIVSTECVPVELGHSKLASETGQQAVRSKRQSSPGLSFLHDMFNLDSIQQTLEKFMAPMTGFIGGGGSPPAPAAPAPPFGLFGMGVPGGVSSIATASASSSANSMGGVIPLTGSNNMLEASNLPGLTAMAGR